MPTFVDLKSKAINMRTCMRAERERRQLEGGSHTVDEIVGQKLPSFPRLTALIRGFHGILVLGGAPGWGKSTLAAMIAAEVVSEEFPGVYYETENRMGARCGTVVSATWGRLLDAYGDDPRFVHLEYTGDYQTAITRLRSLRAPAFLVIDNLQGSVGVHTDDAEDRTQPQIRARLQELIALTDEGFTILVASQLARSAYRGDGMPTQRPSLSSFKYSGDIEHAAWIAAHIWPPFGRAPMQTSERLFTVVKTRLDPSRDAGSDLRLVLDGARLREDGLVERRGSAGGSENETTPRHLRPLLKFVRRKGGEVSRQDAVRYFKSRGASTVERWLKQAVDADLLHPVAGERGRYRAAATTTAAAA